ncbi:hypothetical protein LPJ64_005853 [Coemansia asiatica]|uniref:Uncharacterized protein n=1 Tax=Coemansia asiatica TaxID=1052880 RepID=A0A9W8CG04_9FUNG|nr:hypothetical protein LPJ64_005853 [Coemansia asiatica]
MSQNNTSVSENAGTFSMGKGLRTVWSIEDDYTFVYTLSQNTECSDKIGLVLNHKYVEPSIIIFVQQLLNQNLSIDEVSERLAKKFPNKSQDLRSTGCLKLLIELKSNLPGFAYSQLNHKHINMWTRSIVPFRNLFNSGGLFKGKSKFHKDCKRFVKCILEFLVYEQAVGSKDDYKNIFVKGPSQGSKLLEQWLNAMFKVHGKDMASFLRCCSVKLARSFVSSTDYQQATVAEKGILKKQDPSIGELIPILKSYLSQINEFLGESNDFNYDFIPQTVMSTRAYKTPSVASRTVANSHNPGPAVIPRIGNNAIMMEKGHFAGPRYSVREAFYGLSPYQRHPEYCDPRPAHFVNMHEYPQHPQAWCSSMPVAKSHPVRFYPPEPQYDYGPAYHAGYAYDRPGYASRERMVGREPEYAWPQSRAYEQQHHQYAREQAACQQRTRLPSVSIDARDSGSYSRLPRVDQYRSHPYARPLRRSSSPSAYKQESSRQIGQEYSLYTKKTEEKSATGPYSNPGSTKQSPTIQDRFLESKSKVDYIVHKDTDNAQVPRDSSAECHKSDNTAAGTPVSDMTPEKQFQPTEMISSNTAINEQLPKKPFGSKLFALSVKPDDKVSADMKSVSKNVVVISNNRIH